MMDIDGNGLVTLEEMLATVGQCRQISYTLTTEDGIALQDVLAKVVASVRKHSVSMYDLFCSFDTDGNGQIDRKEMVQLVRSVIPTIEDSEVRHILSHMHRLDLDGNGMLSYSEVIKGLQLADITIEDGPSSPRPAARVPTKAVAKAPAKAAKSAPAKASKSSKTEARATPKARASGQSPGKKKTGDYGSVARRKMDKANGTAHHVSRVLPKHVAVRQAIMSQLRETMLQHVTLAHG